MENRIVTTAQGRLRGVPGKNPEITIFKGVPYAQPPVGPLRWRAPQPPIPWEGIREANNFSGMPPQKRGSFLDMDLFDDIYSSEDCLYLNIWTPAKTGEEQLPVFFWIHGGGLQGGFGSDPMIDSEALVEKGVVMVSITYRLGILGYMAHKEMRAESPYGTSGNFGLQDQAAALRWTYENIAQFGGDPEKITIAGQSAGGGSVCSLLTSPLAKGTFRAAIIQSGDPFGFRSPASDRSPVEQAEQAGAAVAAHFGVSSLDELRKIPAQELVHADYNIASDMPGMRFGSFVDGVVLPQSPAECLINGEGNSRVPIMVGCNTREGLGGIRARNLAEFQAAIDAFGLYAEAIRAAYPASSDKEALAMRDQLSCDLWVARLRQWGLQRAKKGLPTWQYLFNRGKTHKGMPIGPVHSAELFFIFDQHEMWHKMFDAVLKDVPPDESYDGSADEAIDAALTKKMTAYWTNFVKNSNPNDGEQLEWNPISESQYYMWLDAQTEMRTTSDPILDTLVAEAEAYNAAFTK